MAITTFPRHPGRKQRPPRRQSVRLHQHQPALPSPTQQPSHHAYARDAITGERIEGSWRTCTCEIGEHHT